MRHLASIIGTVLVCALSANAATTKLPAAKSADEIPVAVASGPAGSLYVTGIARGANRGKIYVARIEAGGARRQFTGYLDGSGEDIVTAIAVDRMGNAYIVGSTGTDAFVAKFDAKGNLLSNMPFGGAGNERAQAVAVDLQGDAYITGWTASSDFPAEGERQGRISAFFVKVHGSQVSGRFTGSGERSVGNAIAVDADNNVYLAGDSEDHGVESAFLWKLNARLEPVYRTSLSEQSAKAVALSGSGEVWVAGGAASTHNGREAFLSRFDSEGSQTFTKRIGGKADDEALAIATDAIGNIYLAGITKSPDFPGVAADGNARAFALKLNAAADRALLTDSMPADSVAMAIDSIGNMTLASRDQIQRVATCRYRLSKALHHFDPTGGEGSLLMDAPGECLWTPESNAAWITVARVGDRIEFLAAPNDSGAPRGATIVAGGEALVMMQGSKGDRFRSAIAGAIRSNAGFQTSRISACDDCSASSAAALGFSINFFGTTYSQVYVNNNGNVTFGSANGTFTPSPISAIRSVLIAPFWADVDTNGSGSGLTTYGTDTVNGRRAFGANWVDVGYYSGKTNKRNSMQLVLIDRGDLGVGFFDIELNYSSIQWETGDASGGSNGLGGTPARAGFSNGTGAAGTYFELPGSGVSGAFLDGGPNSLAANSSNSGGVAGRYIYNVRAGSIVCGTGLNTTSAALPLAGGNVPVTVTASNPACTWIVSGLPTWITVSTAPPGYGTGSGTVTLVVAANSGPARSAVVSIASQNFTITQAGTSGPVTCPPVTFARGADVSMMSGTQSQGSIAGLERNSDGSLTQHSFTGNTTTYSQTSTPNYQQTFNSCTGRTPGTATPPPNYRFLAETRGISAGNPIIADLRGNGTSSAIGVAPYSQDSSKLQVWNSAADRTPGPKTLYDIPANPLKLIAADFNNDNKRDILLISQGVTGANQGIISIFLGNGDGTLGTRRDINVGSNPQSATVFDFNGDNRLDIAVTNTGNSTLMILNGNGDGTFQAPFTVPDAPRAPTTGLAEAAGPRGVASADINKDGRPDLIIGHNDGVDIRLGNGNGTFQTAVRVARGFIASFVASGDLNKDGNPDIVVSSEASSAVTVLLGNGNGTFQNPNSYVTRNNAGPFFVSDFDWDGNPDVVFSAGHPDAMVASSGDTSITVLYGRGNGTLYGAPAIVLPSLGDFTAGDFNGDGFPDVASTAPLSGGTANTTGLYLALNNGAGALVPQTPISVNSLAISRIASADFNGDNKRDVAVTSGGTIQVLTGNGSGGFSAPGSVTGGSQMTFLTAADVSGDGRQDLIFTDDGEDRVSVALGNGNGTFQARVSYAVGVDPKSVAIADVNGDGRPDLVVANNGTAGNDSVPGGISVLLGTGNGAFGAATNFASSLHPTNVTIGDLNGDGRPDLIVSTGGPSGANYVAVHLNSGNGAFATPSLVPVGFGPAQTALTDFNADGKVDIVVGHCCGDVQMGVLLGNGNGTFQTESNVPNTGNGSSFVVAADVNGDSKPDIIFGANSASGSGAFVATLLNATAGTTPPPTCSFTVSQSSYSPGAGAQTLTGTLTASASTCAFTATSSASWLTVTPASGTGTTNFSINVEANNGIQRSANVTIGGVTITVTQAAPACPYSLSPFTLSPPPAGGPYSITVTSNPGCAWSVSGVPSWVTIQSPAGLSGSGTGSINLTVAANPGAARIATLTIAGQAFAITQAGIGPNGGLRFTAVPPCRILETRAEYNFEGRTGVFGPPFFAAGETRTIPVPNSTVCRTIPANARAFVLNVTLVPSGAVDFVTVFPAGETRPDFWTVRSPDGLIVANSAIVAAGTGGGISVYASNRTDMIIDISGYFTDDAAVSNLVYYPLTPCRVIETRIDYRSPAGPFGPPTMNAQSPRTFRFPGNPYCNVPTGAAAYAATITVVPPGSLAFLTAWPAGQSMPNVSSMNSPAGRVLANSVIVPASPDGSIQLFTYDRSDVIVDITGYFGPDDGISGMFYFPVRQCRVSQTNGTGFTGVYAGPIFENESVRTIPIPTSACFGVPATARAFSLNATVMPGGSPMPFLTIYPTGQSRPNASVINAFEGQTVSSGFLVTAGTGGAVDIFAYRRTHVALEISGYFGR